MSEKIKVTVQDQNGIREYKGDLIHLNVFSSTGYGMEQHGETTGSNFIPAAAVGGAAESVLDMIKKISRTPQAEQKLLMIVAERLIERMEKADRQEPEPKCAEIHISGGNFKQFLKDILAVVEDSD